MVYHIGYIDCSRVFNGELKPLCNIKRPLPGGKILTSEFENFERFICKTCLKIHKKRQENIKRNVHMIMNDRELQKKICGFINYIKWLRSDNS